MKVRVKTFEVEHGVVVRSQARLAPMVLYGFRVYGCRESRKINDPFIVKNKMVNSVLLNKAS